MYHTLPTVEQVEALHSFTEARSEEAWQNGRDADGLPEAHLDVLRRLCNSNRNALAGMTAYLLACLAQGQRLADEAARIWGFLTECGEEWIDHPDWKPEWTNPARARLR